MDACLSVEREVDKVLSKFTAINEHAQRTLTEQIQYYKDLIEKIEGADPSQSEEILENTKYLLSTHALPKLKEVTSRIASEHRDLHGTVSKVGKAIDRGFTADFAATSSDLVFGGPEKEKLLNEACLQHFYREGRLDIAEELIKESSLNTEIEKKEPFLELNKIIESLKHQDLEPALNWAWQHRERLDEKNSSLEFKLHKLQFIKLLSEGKSNELEAIQYARRHFSRFAAYFGKEIQSLMGALTFIPVGVANSPYNYLLNSSQWEEICESFTKEACSLLGLSVQSPLSICINAGCTALPALLNIKYVMQQRLVSGIWSAKDELPIEIDLGDECRYHSIFACPILKQQCSDSNPPMRLVCGHCISRDALQKLSTGNKLKCPYCPQEQSPSDARQIYF